MKKNVLVVFTFFFAVIVMVYVAYFGLILFIPKNEVTVPYVLGMHENDAKKELRRASLKINTVYVETSDHGDNRVFHQYPKHGRVVLKNFMTRIYVAKNDDLTSVPDLSGMDRFSAQILLEKSDLQMGKVSFIKGRINLKNQIFFQQPTPGIRCEKNTPVDIYINDGLLKEDLIVSYFMKNDYNYIKDILRECGLKEADPKDIGGEIISQSLSPGNIVRFDESISFEIKEPPKEGVQVKQTPITEKKTAEDFHYFDYAAPSFFGKRRLIIHTIDDKGREIIFDSIIESGFRLTKLIKYKGSLSIEINLGGQRDGVKIK